VGYSDVITSCLEGARFLSFLLKDTGYFDILSEIHRQGNEGLPLVCICLKAVQGGTLNFDEYDIMHTLRQKGWVVPAYKLPPAMETKTILRIVVREIHTKSILEKLGTDLVTAYETLYERHGAASPEPVRAPAMETKAQEHREDADAEKATGKDKSKVDDETFTSVC
jgi:glutamate decarboxylase